MSSKIIVTILSIFFFVFIYSGFSLYFFDGLYSFNYLIGLSNPNEYYQKNISPILLQYGKEYEINDTNILDSKIYKDNNINFEFKYPSYMEARKKDEDYVGYDINFFSEQNPEFNCILTVDLNGFGLGKNSLPKLRKSIESNIHNGEELMYIRTQNGDIYRISSSNFYADNDNNFTGITFWGVENNKNVRFWNSGNNCKMEILKNIFATFEFKD